MKGGGRAFGQEASVHYLPEDIMTKILLRLPTAQSIARFRCVCKSWRNLFSDPNFLRKFLFSGGSSIDQRSLQILVTGYGGRRELSSYYSIRSYETLGPILEKTRLELPRPPRLDDRNSYSQQFRIVGCCDGIFCLSHWKSPCAASEIFLWNPTTSEIKFVPVGLPPSPVVFRETLGFGFDPETEDYKIVREIDYLQYSRTDSRAVARQVYSLRNDSWKTVSGGGTAKIGRFNQCVSAHQPDTSRNEKCYWFGVDGGDHYHSGGGIISFHMRDEVFDLCPIPKLSEFRDARCWSCVVSKKDAVLANLDCGGGMFELWGMLKLGVAESWTKLFAFEPSLPLHEFECLGSCEDGRYICLHSDDGRTDKAENRGDYFYIFDPATEETTSSHRRLEKIEGTGFYLDAHAFTPTRASLSSKKSRHFPLRTATVIVVTNVVTNVQEELARR